MKKTLYKRISSYISKLFGRDTTTHKLNVPKPPNDYGTPVAGIYFTLFENGNIVTTFNFEDNVKDEIISKRLSEFLSMLDRPEMIQLLLNNLLSISNNHKETEGLVLSTLQQFEELLKRRAEYINAHKDLMRQHKGGPLIPPSDVFGIGKIKRMRTKE